LTTHKRVSEGKEPEDQQNVPLKPHEKGHFSVLGTNKGREGSEEKGLASRIQRGLRTTKGRWCLSNLTGGKESKNQGEGRKNEKVETLEGIAIILQAKLGRNTRMRGGGGREKNIMNDVKPA